MLGALRAMKLPLVWRANLSLERQNLSDLIPLTRNPVTDFGTNLGKCLPLTVPFRRALKDLPHNGFSFGKSAGIKIHDLSK